MKPILFNDDMVRAIIRGEKTATRRIIKPQPKARLVLNYESRKWKYPDQWLCDKVPKRFSLAEVPQNERGDQWTPPCIYADLLYVREAWRRLSSGKYEYRADFPGKSAGKWRPSIHMPKDAARLYLHVDCVSCERLQEITESRAYAEVGWDEREPDRLNLDRFYDQWRKCYGEESIAENPWVWVIAFHVISKP